MGTSTFAVVLAVSLSTAGWTLSQAEIAEQSRIYQEGWGTELVWKFDELPTEGSVPEYRIPYSGHIYPDLGGGTSHVLRKYDAAFNGRRMLATGHEQWDTSAFKEPTPRRGLFGALRRPKMETPAWHGHCNGWTAAAIRHAEPQKSVVRNGVTFTPADIKALLAEIYMYSHYESLAGSETASVNPAALHVNLANWLGRESHPLAMEAVPGRERWNFPIYSYKATTARNGQQQVEVRVSVNYAYYSSGEFQQSPRIPRQKSFHYLLDLNAQGNIVGGSYYRDSSTIDLLWVPLRPPQGGRSGNERGNPYVDVEKVLAIWQDSVPQEVIQKWANIDTGERPEAAIASAEKPEAEAKPEAEPSDSADTPAEMPTEETAAASAESDSPEPPAATTAVDPADETF